MALSTIKHTGEEYIIIDYKKTMESISEGDRVENEEMILVRGGRVAYLIKSIKDFQAMVKETKGNLTACSQPLSTFIFQFYIVEKSKLKYRRHMPILSFVDLVLSQQSELIEELGKYLYKVKESNRIQQGYVKEKEINELMTRYVLSSTNALVCCHLDIHKFINYISEFLFFLGLFKRTAILFDGLENTIEGMNFMCNEVSQEKALRPKDIYREITPVRVRGRLINNEEQLTSNSGSLPIIPEKDKTKSTVRSKKAKRSRRATPIKDYITYNPFINEERKGSIKSKRQLQSSSCDKTSSYKVLKSKKEEMKRLIPKPNTIKGVTIDYAIKNIYKAFTVKDILRNIKIQNPLESEQTSDKEYAR